MKARDSLERFLRRQSIKSFETAFGSICIFGGASSLFGLGIISGPLTSVLGGWFALILNAAFAVSGVLLFCGVGCGRRDIETMGLALTMTCLVSRNLAMLLQYGFNWIFVVGYFNALAFSVACYVSLRRILNKKVLVEIGPDGQ